MSAAPTVVRRANHSDIPWLLRELQAFDRFFGAGRSLFPGVEFATAQLGLMLDQPEHFPFFVVAEKGFIVGVCQPHFFNPAIRVLSELFWWVAPEHRGSRVGLQLLQEYIRYGLDHADWVTMTVEDRSPVRPETLLRRGFRVFEHTYLLEVER